MDIRTPFSDAIEKNPVPTKGTGGGSYDSPEVPGGPSRDGGLLPELYRDDIAGAPSNNGTFKTPFSGSV